MGQREYRRNSRGQFAGSGGRVTYGKAGGFANAQHRANAQNAKAAESQNQALSKGTSNRNRRHGLSSSQKKILAKTAVRLGTTLAIGYAVDTALGGSTFVARGVRSGARSARVAGGTAYASRQGWKAGRGMARMNATRRGIGGTKRMKYSGAGLGKSFKITTVRGKRRRR